MESIPSEDVQIFRLNKKVWLSNNNITVKKYDLRNDFYYFWATNFLTKSGQIIGDFWGYLEKHHLSVKTSLATFR